MISKYLIIIKTVMKTKYLIITSSIFLGSTVEVQAQSTTDTTKKQTQKKYQAKAPKTRPFGAEAFKPSTKAALRWLGMAGYFSNSRGTALMIAPLLEGFDMPIMTDFAMAAKDVPRLDAVLVTH